MTDKIRPLAKRKMTQEELRLQEDRGRKANWKRWGPYLSERQWGTVREDYSADGTAWEYFPHDHARSRAYRWGEDGLGGICDRHQYICFALALWNGKDPILKERLFGLTGNEGNHGEDVKEYYFYLDSTPTHSYMRFLYKYPQAEFPYGRLVEENAARGNANSSIELIDTGVFDEDRYFDIFVEYAKAEPEDILIRITAINRGPEAAPIFTSCRRSGSATPGRGVWMRRRPKLRRDVVDGQSPRSSSTTTTTARAGCTAKARRDAVHARTKPTTSACLIPRTSRPTSRTASTTIVVHGVKTAVNPALRHQSRCALSLRECRPARRMTLRLRLSRTDARQRQVVRTANSIKLFAQRKAEADEFYRTVIPETVTTINARSCVRPSPA